MHSDTKRRFCVITLVLGIVFTIILAGFAVAPVISIFFGIAGFFAFVLVNLFMTVGTAGTIWLSTSYKDFQGSFWSLIVKAFSGGEAIRDALSGSIIWILVVLFVLSTVSFIYNLIYFIREGRENVGTFIASCVFLTISIVFFTAGFFVYLK